MTKEYDAGRRQLLAGLAAGIGAMTLPGCKSGGDSGLASAASASSSRALPDPRDSGIDHIVLLMMENRSFDHFLGWVPGADGVQAGLSFPDRAGVMQNTYPMLDGHASPWQGCGSSDPNHGYEGGRIHLQGGWLHTDPTLLGDTLPLGYYRREDLPFYSGVADDWTICDNYFSGIMAGTWPNRFYMHAGDNDFLDGDGIEKESQLPSLWDALATAGVEGRYYYGNLPFVGLWSKTKYLSISRPLETFFVDCALGNLPAISYVDPIFESGAPNALSNDDHPHSDVRAGQVLLNRVYDALRTGPQWGKTLLIINYDEWGGFFDHVAPPIVPPSTRDLEVTGNDGRLGFRVPCALIGPRARRGHVCHDLLHPNAILNFFSWRFDLPPIGSRAAHSGNLAHALDWDHPPNLASRGYSVQNGTYGLDCQRYSNWPQINLPGPLDPGVVLPLPTLSLPSFAPTVKSADELHVRQLRGLYEKAGEHGFWTGPVAFPS
ncbi:MAG: alkaline phosphatase family protein [Nevskiales bacterium]